MAERAHFIIRGRVQGVCFRMYAQDQARKLGVTGWVRNQPDGSVEIVAEGSREALDALEAWCAQGPPHARVHDVSTDHLPATGEFSDFRIAF